MVGFPRISPPSHPTFQAWSIFSQCHPPHLTFLHGCHGMQDCWLELFPKAEKVHNNAAPASVPVGLHHHDSGHLTDGDHFRTATESFYVCPGSGRTSRL